MEHGTAGEGRRGSDWREREERLLNLGLLILKQLIQCLNVRRQNIYVFLLPGQ